MSPEMLPRIFEMFTQGEHRVEHPQSGLGIGLTLAKRLVEMHGGQISARSQGHGKGSEFAVRLPRTIAPVDIARVKGIDGPAPRGNWRLLVVDDNHDSADSL